MTTSIMEINKIITKELWFDFEIKSFDSYTLVVVGGIDLYYNWILEITFKGVSFVQVKNEWKSKDNLDFLEIIVGDKGKSLRKRFLINDSHYIFAFNHEDINTDNSNQFIISAEEISYRTNTP